MSAKDKLDSSGPTTRQFTTRNFSPRTVLFSFSLAILSLAIVTYSSFNPFWEFYTQHSLQFASPLPLQPENAAEILSRCQSLRTAAGPLSPATFRERTISDRFDPEMNHNTSYLIKNATIWTGEKNGTNVINGSLWLANGIVMSMGENLPRDLMEKEENLTVVEAEGRWVTPGLVDINSHLGVFSLPAMSGSYELDSMNGPILPWLRSIDGFHTYDEGIKLAVAGGVTSVQVLAGSANPIGGQAYVVKLRKTSEGSPSSMIVEARNESSWLYLMQSCSEKTRRYGNRMDGAWALRSAYYEAKKLMKQQDAFCARVESGLWHPEERAGEAIFPSNWQWELLVDVLRGKVKVTNDCHEVVDLDRMVRLSNEFNFSLDTILHGSEAWLVPGLLQKAAHGPPAVAMLSTNHHYSGESLRGSEFAPRVLSDHNISVIITTEGSSRGLLLEAQKAFHYGLGADLTIASITSVPAEALGLSHRLGILNNGSDADVVLWDSHPLRLGATPVRVWIDGIMQLPRPEQGEVAVRVLNEREGKKWEKAPEQPNYDTERRMAVEYESQPPMTRSRLVRGKMVFLNVGQVWRKGHDGGIEEIFPLRLGNDHRDNNAEDALATVIVEEGKVTCVGTGDSCSRDRDLPSINLQGGSISPGLMTYGSLLGIEEIEKESSTQDGSLYNAFVSDVPAILNDVGGTTRAADALVFGTRHVQKAYRNGITAAVSSLARPFHSQGSSSVVIWGLSVCFSTGSKHAFEQGAIIQEETALHVRIGRPHFNAEGKNVAVSAQIAGLRRLLHGWESEDTNTGLWFRKAAEGVIPFVIDAHNADIMASLLSMKAEVDERIGGQMRMVFVGATEAHLLAKEIGEARVGVILTSLQGYPATWDERRILPGPPLSNETILSVLLQHGVTVGIGMEHPQTVGDTRFILSQALLDAQGCLDWRKAYELGSTNLQRLLGVTRMKSEEAVLIACEKASMLDMTSKIVAAITPQHSGVELF